MLRGAKPWLCQTPRCLTVLGQVEGRVLIPRYQGTVNTKGEIIVRCPACGGSRLWVPERVKVTKG